VSTLSPTAFGRVFFRAAPRMASELQRGQFFASIFIFACVNGFTPRIVGSIEEQGWASALLGTFDISVIVLVACGAGVALILRDRTPGLRPLEFGLGAGSLLLAMLPIYATSWIAVTVLSLYLLFFLDDATPRRGAVILFAATVPMLWSRLLFKLFSDYILGADATLVSWLLGTHRAGTFVGFADGSGELVIHPGCSSLTNVSLAFLCWITFSELVAGRKSAYDYLWCLLACFAVIAVNVSRIAVLGSNRANYLTFHTEWCDALVDFVILGLVVGISALGVRRELFGRV
jgi:hypothetical protein